MRLNDAAADFHSSVYDAIRGVDKTEVAEAIWPVMEGSQQDPQDAQNPENFRLVELEREDSELSEKMKEIDEVTTRCASSGMMSSSKSAET